MTNASREAEHESSESDFLMKAFCGSFFLYAVLKVLILQSEFSRGSATVAKFNHYTLCSISLSNAVESAD